MSGTSARVRAPMPLALGAMSAFKGWMDWIWTMLACLRNSRPETLRDGIVALWAGMKRTEEAFKCAEREVRRGCVYVSRFSADYS